jgi:ribosomal protein L22
MADEQEKQATAAKGEVKIADEKKPAAKSPAKKSDASAEKKTDAKAEKKTETKVGRAKKPATGKPATAKTAAKKPAKKTAPAELVMVRATARYVRSSPRKSRLVVDHIRGDKVEDARVKLQFIARHVARDVAKVLESAVSNAEHNHELDADDLTIAIAYVDEGPTLKRWRPRARGRASQILKRTSHITVVVSNGTAEQITEFSSRKAAA